MITHMKNDSWVPSRVVILGGSGFVGCAVAEWLINQTVEVLSISSKEVDLLKHDAKQKLIDLLYPSDTLILVSAIAPVKNAEMLEQNIRMARAVSDAIQSRPVNHLLYVSSDAVYGDFDRPINEQTYTGPGSLHGVMHLARELILSEAAKETPFGIVRPTLVYGPNDPHNGYGPNMFRRRLASDQPIFLFGKVTFIKFLVFGDIVVSFNWAGGISPKPLKRLIIPLPFNFSFIILSLFSSL